LPDEFIGAGVLQIFTQLQAYLFGTATSVTIIVTPPQFSPADASWQWNHFSATITTKVRRACSWLVARWASFCHYPILLFCCCFTTVCLCLVL
jgi:hypothetical protein